MSRLRFLWTAAVLGVVSTLSAVSRAAEEKIWTQVPEVARSIATGETATAPTEPEAVHRLFDGGAKPKWIWGPDANEAYFVTKALPDGQQSAWLKATADNKVTVWVNDNKVLEHGEWNQAPLVDISASLKPAGNVLRARIENAGGPAAFLAKVVLRSASGTVETVVTDETWIVTRQRNSRESLPVKVIGELGMAPYGDPFNARPESNVVRDVFTLLPGFQVERLFTVPKDDLGSWVCLTTDPKGRLIVSDQGNKGLYRVTPPAIGSQEPTRVEKIDLPISSAQGLLWAFDSLYISVNGGPGSGLYRAKDTNGDDQLDEVKKLHEFRGGGEHGPHALRLSPDGKSIVVIAGNHTRPPFEPMRNGEPQTMGGSRPAQLHTTNPEKMSSRIPTNWDEDLLLRRQWDANGHAAGVLAPGGWIAQTDPEGEAWEILSVGYRNPYDMDFNADGELFAYDADMEWDIGAPWYRPTRVVHATSGSEFGWRSGTGKWPTHYPDSLPELIDIGPGSPVGVEFGYGTKFPAKYQKALYICDWTFGTMYAIHITPQGASYTATKEEFVARTPLPLTDVTVGKDGALYFTIGGRGTQSELFRVTYVGPESTAPVDARDPQYAELRALRRQLEALHSPQPDPAAAVAQALPYLGHPDRHIRYAARIAIENQPVASWKMRDLERDPELLITAAVAIARQADADFREPVLRSLLQLPVASLTEAQQFSYLRAVQLLCIRLGTPEEETAQALIAKIDPLYPSQNRLMNRELCDLLVYLQAPSVIPKTLALLQLPDEQSPQEITELLNRNPGYGGSIKAMLANQPDTQKVHLLFSLRNLKTGWTLDQRKAYFDAVIAARGKSGGNSYRKFIQNIDREAFENATEAERLAIEALGARPPYQAPELPKPQGPGKDWTLEELLALTGEQPLKGRNFKNGEKMFAATRCIICHRFAGDGGATGPDLTQSAGRFNYKDLCEAIVDPSKVVSDQYKATTVETKAGKVYTGRVVSEVPESITLSIDPEDATKLVTIPLTDIEERQLSPISLMPKDLLKPLNREEVLDLLAYLLSRGNPNDPVFRK